MQELARERLRAADPAAAREELERVDREEQPVLEPVALDERVDLFVGRAALEPPLDRERQHRDRGRRRLRVDRAHAVVAELGRGSDALWKVPDRLARGAARGCARTPPSSL